MKAILSDLTAHKTLAPKYRDHRLTGNWTDHRDCHVRPDLVLIYRLIDPEPVKPPKRPDAPKLQLVRLGSHSELGL
jgi:mRNA interferase YafQ